MINGRWKNSLFDVRVMRGADCSSDHHLIIGKINLKLRKTVKKKTNKRNIYDTDKLEQPEIQKKFRIELRNRFRVLENLHQSETDPVESLEQEWKQIKTIYNDTSSTILGYKNHERKQWISDSTWNSIQERKDIKKKLNNAKSERIKTALQREYSDKDKVV